MIHGDTELRFVDENIGSGVYATNDIPSGTMVYVKDELEIILTADDIRCFMPPYNTHVEKYAYTEADGNRVLSWDHAKYVNHSCDANTLSTGFGFEIAVKDIKAGEQITDDYGLLNIEKVMYCGCQSPKCRNVIGANDFDLYYQHWDWQVQKALAVFNEVEQPLLSYMADPERTLLERYLKTGEGYISVRNLEYRIKTDNVA